MQNWTRMTKDGEEKLVHPGNVNNHKRFGWMVVPEVKAPLAVQPVSTETAAPGVLPERVAALDRFTRMLASARKKPEGATAKIFERLGVVIVDPPGDVEPWPPHVLMAQVIDALAKMPDSALRMAFIVGLFGRSGSYASELIAERVQALAGEQ